MNINKLNNTGPKYNRAEYMQARAITMNAVSEIASRVEAGMSEHDGTLLVETVLKDQGYERYWHPHKFRIGKNTVCAFRDVSDSDVRLKKSDLFFIDIGPIFYDHEADYGKTFVHGQSSEYQAIAYASEALFLDCQSQWAQRGLTGVALYEYAKNGAQQMGYILEERQSGHRLGDFPHALHFRGRLGEVNAELASDLWVLEIHLLDKGRQYGAFYEDILITKQ